MLHKRGLIAIRPTEVERLAALAEADNGALVVADTRDQVRYLNAAIRDQRLASGETAAIGAVMTATSVSPTATPVTGTDDGGGLPVSGRGSERRLPAPYVHRHVELAYATTVYGAQGETVDRAHLLICETTGPPRRPSA